MQVVEAKHALAQTEEWKERLVNMTVTHQVIYSAIEKPKLTDGQQRVEGIEAISQFLDDYERDVAAWNQDRCDMWFFYE